MAERRKKTSRTSLAESAIPDLSPHILDSMLDAVVVANPDGTVRTMNRAALELLGYAAAEVAGQQVGRFFEEEAFFRGTGLARLAREVETTLITRAGERVPVVFNGSVVRDAKGQLLAVVGVARDTLRGPTRRLIREAEARAAESHVLKTVADVLNRAVGLQEALDRSLEAVMGLIGSEAGWILLLDELGGTRLAAAHNLPPALEADDRAAMRGPCQCLDLLRRGHLQAAANIVECERLRTALGDTRGLRHHASVPLRVGGRALGNLNLATPADRVFTDDELRLLTAVGDQIGVAIERARLFEAEREQRELAEALRDAATALSATLDFDTVLDRLLEQIARVMPYDTANVMLLDAPTGRIRVARQRGYGQFGEQVIRDIAALSFDIAATANLHWMAETGRPLVIPDTAAYPDWVKVEASAHVRSWAGAPIVVDGQVIAFFSLDKIEPNFYRPEHGAQLAAFAGQAALALQNARLFEETGQRVQELALLYDAGLTLNRVLEPRTQLESLLKLATTALRADAAEFFVFDSTRDELRYEFGIGLSAEAADSPRSLHFAADDENTVTGWVATNRMLLNLPDAPADPRWVVTDPSIHSVLFVPVVHEEQLRGILGVKSKSGDAFTPQDERLLTLFANQVSVAMNNARLFEETQRRAAELETLAHISSALRQAQTREAMLSVLVEKSMEALQADAGALILLEEGALVFAAARGPAEAMPGLRHPPGDDPLWQVTRTGEPLFIPDVTEHGEFNQWEICRVLMSGLRACACVPLKTAEATVGLLHLASRSKRVATEGEIRLLTSIAEMAGNALDRATLHEQTTQRLQRLAILRAIDMAISASLDLHVTLNTFLDQVTTQLRLDAADVLLLNPHTQTLEYAVGRGFRGSAITRTRVRLGEGHAGRAALERCIVHASNLPQTRPAGLRTQQLTSEEAFVTYYAVPLIAKGEVKGVLEIFHRTSLSPDPEWLDFLEDLAVQAAIAIDNAALYDNLQRSNTELALAYDTTIEGWSKALDLRDKETEGHTRRVTELTLRLARVMGIPDAELVHIRRGALLHDIGKMGVPDTILLKLGPLTDEEWAVMRLHPVYAHDLLTPIAYLRPALDIPYCHHEKWNGTGYPRGLKGEQIPLAARVFAVADVWDALRSDRPYRAAWPEEKVRQHIREQAGKHFDPQVAKTLLELDVQP